MNPLPTMPTDPAAPPAQPLVEFIRVNRQGASYVLLGLSLAFLVATVALGYRAFQGKSITGDSATKAKADSETSPDSPKLETVDLKRPSYMVGWIGTVKGFLITGLAGVVLLAGLPKLTLAAQQAEARIMLLATGGALGFLLIVYGIIYFYLWSDSLSKWGEAKERVFVLIPFLMVVAGAGLVFFSVQPARADERNNEFIRKWVYGTNFGLATLLVLVGLIVLNVVVSLKVPNKLDTTETGFYTLNESTKTFLAKLAEPVNLYVILPNDEGRELNDIRQLAMIAQDASDGKLTARFVSPVSNKAELARLLDKYPRLGRDPMGILLTTGADEKRNVFLPVNDLFEVDRARNTTMFAGESKILRELRFLADNEQKPVVYFTQGNGELSIGSGAGPTGALGPSATQLRSFLEKAYLDVKPLVFTTQHPSVPDDAAVVVVAEPQAPLNEVAVGALRKYMDGNGQPDGRKGKLILLAGASSGLETKGVAKTGLEPLLANFNVQLGDKFVYTFDLTEQIPSWAALAYFAKASEQNPITQTIAKQVRALPFQLAREVNPTTANPTFQATTLLLSSPNYPTWLEDERVTDTERTMRDLRTSASVRSRKGFSEDPRSLAVVVSEGGSGRLLVVGNAFFLTDKAAERSQRAAPTSFDLMGVAIDWLRDKPPVASGIESKTYQTYQFPEPTAVDSFRLVWFPLGLGLLVTAALGTGVWVIRRK